MNVRRRLIERAVGAAKPWLVRRVGPLLSPRFSAQESEDLLEEVFERADAGVGRDRTHESMGEALMLACAALTVALYRTLLNRGLGSTEARAVTAKATASIYDRMADFPWRIARVTARTPIGRLRRATRVFRRFPFGPPGYLMEDVFSDENTVAFDVKRCVVAEHFREQGLPELCVETFCNLDFALAQKWGSTLNRTTTLASGAPHCDFRWQIDPPAPAAKAAGRRRGVEGER